MSVTLRYTSINSWNSVEFLILHYEKRYCKWKMHQQRGSTCVLLSMQEENPENVLNTADLSNDN